MRIRVHSVCIHTNMCEGLSFCYNQGSAGREGNCRKGAMTLNSNVPAFMSRTTVNRAWGKYPQITSHEFIHISNQKTFPAPLLPSSPVLLNVVLQQPCIPSPPSAASPSQPGPAKKASLHEQCSCVWRATSLSSPPGRWDSRLNVMGRLPPNPPPAQGCL